MREKKKCIVHDIDWRKKIFSRFLVACKGKTFIFISMSLLQTTLNYIFPHCEWNGFIYCLISTKMIQFRSRCTRMDDIMWQHVGKFKDTFFIIQWTQSIGNIILQTCAMKFNFTEWYLFGLSTNGFFLYHMAIFNPCRTTNNTFQFKSNFFQSSQTKTMLNCTCWKIPTKIKHKQFKACKIIVFNSFFFGIINRAALNCLIRLTIQHLNMYEFTYFCFLLAHCCDFKMNEQHKYMQRGMSTMTMIGNKCA